MSSADLLERELRGWRLGQSIDVIERKTIQTRHGLAQYAMTRVSGFAPCASITIKDGVRTTNKVDGIILGYWLRRGDYGHAILYHTRAKSMFGGSADTVRMRTKLDAFYNDFKPGPLNDG